ncbi:chaperonin 10-like protein [Leptodontidium sp. 2 PMI_412]|nr:chaperonin 10-like protein [Leptodontidium sp. 2 PMI_412]
MASSETNRALWLSSYDEPLSIKELPIPEAVSGTAVIRILGMPLTAVAHLFHTGKIPSHVEPPYVPGPNGVGRVHALGPDAINLKVGNLVYADCTVRGRDDPDVMIMAGHLFGPTPASQNLGQAWRDGSLQQYQRLPLENLYRLDEQRLLGDLAYTPAMLTNIAYCSVAGGAILEAASLTIGETVIIGPCGGAFSGVAVELALAIGANVVALGRSEEKLWTMKQKLNNHPFLTCVVMTGDQTADAAAILKATPKGQGADVYNDWTPGGFETPLFLGAAVQTLKQGGRIVLSGGAQRISNMSYFLFLTRNLTMTAKWMCSRATLFKVIKAIEHGQLALSTEAGSKYTVFPLEEYEQAAKHAAVNGAWRQYTVVAPNQE